MDTLAIARDFIIFFLGALVGHRLTLWRDRRKEFNEVSVPIRKALLKQIKILESGKYSQSLVSNDEFILLDMHLGKLQVHSFRKTLNAYKEAQTTCGHYSDSGRWEIDDLTQYIKLSHRLLSYAQVK